jgi:hypothetical protein
MLVGGECRVYPRLTCTGCKMRRVGKIEALCRWSECLLPDNQWRVYRVRDSHSGDLGRLPVVTLAMGFGFVFEK